MGPGISDKKRKTTLLLCLFLGIFGAHRFYVDKNTTGLICLLTLGGLGVWSLVDCVFIACGEFDDRNGQMIKEWN